MTGFLKWAAILTVAAFLSSCTLERKPVTFYHEPCLIPNEGYTFKLCDDFMVAVGDTLYTAPKGFVSDLASIPRPLWSLMAPHKSNIIPAALIHDALYVCYQDVSREEADEVFYNLLITKGVSQSKAYLLYSGVRLFGFWGYTC